MGKHMDERTRALCFFYRNPPPTSGVTPQPYADIPALVRRPGEPLLRSDAVYRAVRKFHSDRNIRGRKKGWRKTSKAEDQVIMKTFLKVRQPLGSAVDARDVINNLPKALRTKVCLRTVRNRLLKQGFTMQDKKSKDDMGDLWRKTRVQFCKLHASKSALQWCSYVQAVGDFRYFSYYPRQLKTRHKVKSCAKTIMRKGERNKPAFLKPKRHIFQRSTYRRVRKVKVFGLTTSTGQSLSVPCPLHPQAKDWIKLVRGPVSAFLKACLPNKRICQVLLDGESILHTAEAKIAMKEHGVRILPRWPSHSPDLNPQENVWAWAEKDLRRAEKKEDTFTTFKWRVAHVSKRYPNSAALVPSMAKRIAECMKRKGANIGK